jgi:acetyl esterase/lipase
MEWVYLAISINGAVYTANALKPIKQNRLLFGWSFFASWITIELAWLHVAWQVATTAWFARRGVLRSGKGKLALLLNLFSLAGLGVMIWRSLGARHEVRAAFADIQRPVSARRSFGIKKTRNVTFTRAGGKNLRMDISEPAVAPKSGEKRPAIVQIHGGGWVIGDKREQGLPLLKYLANEGWVGFNVNYRLSPGATFPDHLVDIKHAIAYIRDHAEEYHIDPDFIAVTGGSAGGHLASLTALTANDPRYQPGFEDADTSIQAAVPFYGVFDFMNRKGYYPPEMVTKFLGPMVVKAFIDEEPEKFSAASPIDQVHPDAPPFLVVHGDKDTLAPVEGARDFVDELRATSKAPVLYLELKGAQHAFEIFPSIRANHVVRAAVHFLDTIFAEHQAGIAPADVPADELVAAVDTEIAENVTA